MRLTSKLASTHIHQTIPELNTLLERPHRVSTSWTGKRLVSVEGYTGEADINHLVNIYLRATPFQPCSRASIRERVECYDLWEKIEDLCKRSNEDVQKTRCVHYFTSLREAPKYLKYDGNLLTFFQENEFKRHQLFEFSPERFKAIWPYTQSHGVVITWCGDSRLERWIPTKQMVDQALRDGKLNAQDSI